jgi:predicted DNA-binding transcriptional regulator AlpA
MPERQLLALKDVLKKCKFSRSTLYQLMESRGFPKPLVLLGEPGHPRSVTRWDSAEVDEWISAQVAAKKNKRRGEA